MRPTRPISDPVAWSRCLSVCHVNSETCNNGSTDQDVVWDLDEAGVKEPCILNGDLGRPMQRRNV